MSTRNNSHRISGVSAFVIAGGKGNRFGGDKLNHLYRGKPLISHSVDVLTEIFSDVAIIANDCGRFAYLGLPCFADIVQNAGPLAGILTALHYSPAERTCAVAGDMPNISAELLVYLADISKDYDVTVPVFRGEFEPLHAVYSKKCEKVIREALERGERRIVSFFNEVRVRKVSEEEMRAFAYPEKIFFNVNYREDLTR